MVVFACNHCGESLKKQVVEKHYQQKCRRNPIFVSCMDCMKDFSEQEYTLHIKCITEAEKYSGKDYVAKPSQNKGEKKQEAWTDLVANVISKHSRVVEPRIAAALEKLLNYNNVPRKQAKFRNFINNTFRLHVNDTNKIWNLFDEEMKKEKETAAVAVAISTIPTTTITDVVTSSTNGNSGKHKLSNGHTHNNGNENNGCNNDEEEQEQPKVKKSKGNEIEDDQNEAVVTTTTSNGTIIESEKFNWEKTIQSVIGDKKEIKLKRLEKKVMKKYTSNGDAEVTEKTKKKFLKKLKKLNYSIDDDVVKIN